MANSCRLKIGVGKNYEGKKSHLYYDLEEAFPNNRDAAIAIYSAVRTPGFLENLKEKDLLEYDELGEPTIESLNRAMPFRDLAPYSSLLAERREAKAVDKNNKVIIYNTLNEALEKCKEFNSKQKDLIAEVVYKSPTEYTINIDKRNPEKERIVKEYEFKNELNKKLNNLFNKMGLAVTIDDGQSTIFDPTTPLTTANGMRVVIKIANNSRNERDFPEEFSHAIIEGMRNHPLVARIMKVVESEEVQREVLGKDYDEYIDKYSKGGVLNRTKMQKEVAGRLLQDAILHRFNASVSESIFDRLKNIAFKNIKNVSIQDIEKAIQEAREATEEIVTQIEDESILKHISVEAILTGQALNHLTRTIDSRAKKLAEEGFKLTATAIRIKQSKRSNREYTKKELSTLRGIKNAIEANRYAQAIHGSLRYALSELASISEGIEGINIEDLPTYSLHELKKVAALLNKINEYQTGYAEVIRDISTAVKQQMDGDLDISAHDAMLLQSSALELDKYTKELNTTYKKLQFATLYSFYSRYWGKEEKVWSVGKKKGQTLLLEEVMRMADRDIGMIDRWITAMADASDPLLALTDKIVKTQQAARDAELEELLIDMRGAFKKLKKAGKDPSFMYIKDKDGVPTGWLLCNINYDKYYEERRAYRDSLKAAGQPSYKIRRALEVWDRSHTQVIKIDPTDSESKTERVPLFQNKDGSAGPYFIDRLSGLSKEEREFYDTMMTLKGRLDNMLPKGTIRHFMAPQIRNSLVGALAESAKNPSKALSMIYSALGDNLIRRADEEEFGKEIAKLPDDAIMDESGERATKGKITWKKTINGWRQVRKVKNVELDFNNSPIRTLPIYYNKRLEDMSRLSTDFISSMLAFASMAINFNEMNKIVDLLELGRDFIHARDVQQYSGEDKVIDSMTVLGLNLSRAHLKKGGKIAERYDDYMDMVVYNRKKIDEGTIHLFGKSIDIAKAGDTYKNYSGLVGLGLNIFSGVSNVTIGKMQMFIDSISNEYFSYKDALVSKEQYWMQIIPALGEWASTKKSKKLNLLMDKFNATEDFYESLKEQGKFTGLTQRIFEGTSLLFLQTIGEHYLHARTMLAMLNRSKVKIKDEEVSLYNAYEVIDITDKDGDVISHKLSLKDGATTVDGKILFTQKLEEELDELESKKTTELSVEEKNRKKELREAKERTFQLVADLKMKIGRVNESMHGAFNATDRGAINKYALGRLALQFRQWMPKHYGRRFGRARWDFILDESTEGYYITLGRIIKNITLDLVKGKKEALKVWKDLSMKEKHNLRRALAEIGAFGMLSLVIMLAGDVKDHKGYWGRRFLLYNLKRMKLETGASVPWFSTIKNFTTLMKSPAAALNVFDSTISIFKFWDLFNIIESGKYKGWPVWVKNAYKATPVIPQYFRTLDIATDSTLFNYLEQVE